MKSPRWRDWLSNREHDMTGGMEVEMYLWDDDSGNLNWNDEALMEMLDTLPQTVYRDYYPYQLEIRTKPHETADGMLGELRKTLQDTWEASKKFGFSIMPASFMNSNAMYNGLHFHIRYKRRNPFHAVTLNSYPFILSIASFFRYARCKERSNVWYHNVMSERMRSSPHIGLPYLNLNRFNSTGTGSDRYKDIVLNKFTNGSRRRLKTVTTLETRMFDVPPDWDSMETLIRLMYGIFSKAKMGTKTTVGRFGDISKYKKVALSMRDQIKTTRNTWNGFFNMPCQQLVNELTSYLGIKNAPKEPIAFNMKLLGKKLEQTYPIEPSLQKRKKKKKPAIRRPRNYNPQYLDREQSGDHTDRIALEEESPDSPMEAVLDFGAMSDGGLRAINRE